MGMDLDYIAGKQAIEELEELFSAQGHGKRERMADEIIIFVDNLKGKIKKRAIPHVPPQERVKLEEGCDG